MVGIAILPKDPAPDDALRLGMTVLFMAAALSLAWSFVDPLDACLAESLDDAYRGAGPEILNTLRLLRVNVMAPVRHVAWLLIAFIALLSAQVLSRWPVFDALAPLDPVWGIGWKLSLAGLVALPFLDGRQIAQAFNLAHQLREQVATSGFRRPSPGAPAAAPRTALRILGSNRFEAGEFAWHWSDFYKNLVVFGQIGSGKTVCVLNPLLQGLVSSGSGAERSAGLILDPKGDFFDKIDHVMASCGRGEDLVVFDPDQPDSYRWNPFDTPDSAEEVANRFGAIFAMQGQGGDKDAFFIQQSKVFLQSALTLLRLWHRDDNMPPSASEVLNIAGNVDDLLIMADWTRKLELGEEAGRDRESALLYIFGTWLTMADDTRNGATSTLSTVLTPFTNRPFDRLMSGRSTLSIGRIIDEGKVLYVHMPTARRRLMAQTVGTLLKVEFSRQVLQRQNKKRPSFFFCDEFQVFMTVDKEANDADFFERCRGSNHANVVATQNRPALLQRSAQPHPIDHLLACCGTKVFLRNTDPETNEWASKQFGEALRTVVSTGQSAGTPRRGGAAGGASLSSTTAFARNIRPDAFVRLGQPSVPEDVRVAESIVLFAARAQVEILNLRWLVHPL